MKHAVEERLARSLHEEAERLDKKAGSIALVEGQFTECMRASPAERAYAIESIRMGDASVVGQSGVAEAAQMDGLRILHALDYYRGAYACRELARLLGERKSAAFFHRCFNSSARALTHALAEKAEGYRDFGFQVFLEDLLPERYRVQRRPCEPAVYLAFHVHLSSAGYEAARPALEHWNRALYKTSRELTRGEDALAQAFLTARSHAEAYPIGLLARASGFDNWTDDGSGGDRPEQVRR